MSMSSVFNIHKEMHVLLITYKIFHFALVFSYTVFIWLNAMAFVSLVQRSMQQLFKTNHYPMLEDILVYTHNFESNVAMIRCSFYSRCGV